MNLYGDEAGYTGGDLLHESQPFFVYAAVNFSNVDLNRMHVFIHQNYPVQNDEIKGKQIVRSTKGQRIMAHLFREYNHCVKMVY